MRRIRGRDCSGNPFWGTQWRKKIVAESTNCPPKIYKKFSVEIVVRIIFGIAVDKPHPNRKPDDSCDGSHQGAFQLIRICIT